MTHDDEPDYAALQRQILRVGRHARWLRDRAGTPWPEIYVWMRHVQLRHSLARLSSEDVAQVLLPLRDERGEDDRELILPLIRELGVDTTEVAPAERAGAGTELSPGTPSEATAEAGPRRPPPSWRETGLYVLLALSALGLAASAAIHLVAWFGRTLPAGAMGLHLGPFVLLPLIIIVTGEWRLLSRRRNAWNEALSFCPQWIRRAIGVVTVYSIANFVWFMFHAPPKQEGVDAVVPAVVARGFSGHWMIFYALAVGLCASELRRLQGQAATRSHSASHTALPGDSGTRF